MIYVLMEYCADNYGFEAVDCVGVFNRNIVNYHELAEYYGEFNTVSHRGIYDSGLVWEKHIKTNDGLDLKLVMHEFELNKVM